MNSGISRVLIVPGPDQEPHGTNIDFSEPTPTNAGRVFRIRKLSDSGLQNVFGFAQTGTRTYFRAVKQSNTPAQIWAVLTRDVVNQVPETGQGSCNVPAGGGTAPVTSTCNTSFVANLTSSFVTTNTASSAGLLQPNTATYYTGDDIATLAGTDRRMASTCSSTSIRFPR